MWFYDHGSARRVANRNAGPVDAQGAFLQGDERAAGWSADAHLPMLMTGLMTGGAGMSAALGGDAARGRGGDNRARESVRARRIA
jgi:hypothetical protein